MKKLTNTVREQADEIREVSTPQDHGLTNTMGRIAEQMLKYHGWYGHTNHKGEKVLIIVKTATA